MRAQRYFEDFAVGERFVLPSRTMTDAMFAVFQLASGDSHPVHCDVEYCRARPEPPWLPGDTIPLVLLTHHTDTGLCRPYLPPLAWRSAGNISAGSGRCV